MSNIRGEYWVIDGYVDFADGDVGDQNHEMIAVNHIVGQHNDAIMSLADELEIEVDDRYSRYDEVNPETVSSVLSAIEEKLTMGDEDSEEEPDPSTLMSEKQAHAYMMQQIGCDADAYNILWGSGDSRLYAMQYLGWIAIRSNNVELYGYDSSRQKEVADAIWEILQEEGEQVVPNEVEVSIYDHKTGRSWYATLEELEEPVSLRTNQQPQTTYNKSLFHFMNPRDEEENKYSTPSKTKTNPWTQMARTTKIIGSGQDLWRGTSESIMNFSEWFNANCV